MSENIENLDTLAVMQTAEGRRLLKRIYDWCGTDHDQFSPDPYRHAYNAGARSIGVILNREMSAHPHLHREVLRND